MSDEIDDLDKLMPAIAAKVWGAPRPGATKTEIRYGEGRTVNPIKGRWWDHNADAGGGVLKLLEAELGLKGRPAFDWLREQGFMHGDAPAPAKPHQPDRSSSSASKPKKEIDRVFEYKDERGNLLFEAVRFGWTDEKGVRQKSFGQRRKPRPGDEAVDIKYGYVWKNDGLDVVPYRLQELLADIASGATIFFVEGEKCVDRLRKEGIPATCNPMGAGKWWPELTPWFEGADIVILPDNDPQATKGPQKEPRFHEDGRPVHVGIDHAERVAGEIVGVAKRVRILELPVPQDGSDVYDWMEEHGGTVDSLYDLAETKGLPYQKNKSFRPKLTSILWRDLDAPGPEHEWLIDDVLTVGEVSMIAGPSRHGKSFAAVDEGLAVARGVPWLGNQTLRGGVIYIAAESGRGVRKRLRAYRAWHELPASEELPFVLLPNQFDLYGSDDHTNALLEDAKLWDTYFKEKFGVPLRLIVIDTFAAATPGADENSSRDVGAALKRATSVAYRTGANIQLVHHMNAGGTKPRGWTGILANIDSVVSVERNDKRLDEEGRPIRFVTMSKNKDGEDGRSFRFVLRQIELGVDKKGKKVTSCVCVPPKEDIDVAVDADAGFNATPSDRQILKAIQDAVKDRGTFPPNDLKVPSRVKTVVSVNEAKRHFKRLYAGGEEGTEEQIRVRLAQRWKRAHDRMVQYSVISSMDSYIWFTGKPVKGMQLTERERMPDLLDDTPTQDALDEIDASISLN